MFLMIYLCLDDGNESPMYVYGACRIVRGNFELIPHLGRLFFVEEADKLFALGVAHACNAKWVFYCLGNSGV